MPKIKLPNLSIDEVQYAPGQYIVHHGCPGPIAGDAIRVNSRSANVGYYGAYWKTPRPLGKLVCTGCGRKVGRQATRVIEEVGVPVPTRTKIPYLNGVQKWKTLFFTEEYEDAEAQDDADPF